MASAPTMAPIHRSGPPPLWLHGDLHPANVLTVTWRRARGFAVWRAFGSLAIATAGQPGGKPSWGPPALASRQRLVASAP